MIHLDPKASWFNGFWPKVRFVILGKICADLVILGFYWLCTPLQLDSPINSWTGGSFTRAKRFGVKRAWDRGWQQVRPPTFGQLLWRKDSETLGTSQNSVKSERLQLKVLANNIFSSKRFVFVFVPVCSKEIL